MKTLTFDAIGEFFLRKKIIEEEDIELYIYGLRQGAIMLLNILTTLALGCLLGMAWESMAYLFTYAPIRTYAGGFHAKTPLRCYLTSVILIIAVLLIIKYVVWTSFLCYAGLAAGSLLIYLLAPVEDKNKPFTPKEEVYFRKKARVLLVIEILLGVVFSALDFFILSACIVMSLNTLALMLILGKIKNNILEKREI